MRRMALLIMAIVLLAGCEPSYKAQFEATKKELEATKAALAQAQKKLKAADNEVRHKIFILIRRASIYLKSKDIDTDKLDQFAQELSLHIDSYKQLNSQADHISITANFFVEKLDVISNLISESRKAYSRRYNECMSKIDSKAGKNDLSNMLCEVQADVAQKDLAKDADSSITALLTITEQQLKAGRQSNSSKTQPDQLEAEFRDQVAELKKSN